MKKTNISLIYILIILCSHYIHSKDRVQEYQKILKRYDKKIKEDINVLHNLSALYLTGIIDSQNEEYNDCILNAIELKDSKLIKEETINFFQFIIDTLGSNAEVCKLTKPSLKKIFPIYEDYKSSIFKSTEIHRYNCKSKNLGQNQPMNFLEKINFNREDVNRFFKMKLLACYFFSFVTILINSVMNMLDNRISNILTDSRDFHLKNLQDKYKNYKKPKRNLRKKNNLILNEKIMGKIIKERNLASEDTVIDNKNHEEQAPSETQIEQIMDMKVINPKDDFQRMLDMDSDLKKFKTTLEYVSYATLFSSIASMIVTVISVVIEFNNLILEKKKKEAEEKAVKNNEENDQINLANPEVIIVSSEVRKENSINHNKYFKKK